MIDIPMGLVSVNEKPMLSMVQPDEGELVTKADESRDRGLASLIWDEYVMYGQRRREKGFDADWIAANLASKGVYSSDWQFELTDSQLFYNKLSERVYAALAKELKIAMPLHGRPWGLKNSPIPTEGADPDGVRKSSALIADLFENAGINGLFRRGALHKAIYGTGVFRRFLPKIDLDDPEAPEQLDAAFIRCFEMYIDPDAKILNESNSTIHRRVLTRRQVEALKGQPGIKDDQVDAYLEANPNGDWVAEPWENAIGENRQEGRYVVLERWGWIDKKNQEKWGIDTPTNDNVCTMSTNGYVLKQELSDMYKREFPYTFVQYEEIDGSPWGRGVYGQAKDVLDMVNACFRAVDEDLAWSSGPMVGVDLNAVDPGWVPKIEPRMMIPLRQNETTKGEVFKWFLVPSKAKELIDVFDYFNKLVDQVTRMPRMDSPKDAGSGVRTDGMQQAYFEAAEDWIKIVVGNDDEHFWKVFVTDAYKELTRQGKVDGDLKPVADGVRQAIQREIVGRKSAELMQILAHPEFQNLSNGPKILTNIIDGMGMEGEGCVLTPEEAAAKAEAMAKKAEMDAKAGSAPDHGFRAETSRRDAVLQLARGIPETNPVWGGATEAAYEAFGAATPQIYGGLKLWAENMRKTEIAFLGDQVSEAAAAIATGIAPQVPQDLDPKDREQFKAMASQQGIPIVDRPEENMGPDHTAQEAPDLAIPQQTLPQDPMAAAQGQAPMTQAALQEMPKQTMAQMPNMDSVPQSMPEPITKKQGKKTVKKVGKAKRHPDGTIEYTTTEEHSDGE